MPGVHAAAHVWPSEGAQAHFCRVPGSSAGHKAGFGKDKRIRTSAEFEALMRSGTRRTLNGFTFFFSVRPSGPARLGILISRKHAAHATVRNRIKRCIREAFRQAQGELGAVDLLVRPPFGFKPTSGTVARIRAGIERVGK
jgi:ribonuclease P protein component